MKREDQEHNRKWREIANRQINLLVRIAQLERGDRSEEESLS
jgi:hypothetical protein